MNTYTRVGEQKGYPGMWGKTYILTCHNGKWRGSAWSWKFKKSEHQKAVKNDHVQNLLSHNMMPWTLNILSWRNLRNGKCRKDSDLPFSPEAGTKTLRWEVPSLCSEERSIFISEDTGTQENPKELVLLNFSTLLPFAHILLFYHRFYMAFHSSSNPA